MEPGKSGKGSSESSSGETSPSTSRRDQPSTGAIPKERNPSGVRTDPENTKPEKSGVQESISERVKLRRQGILGDEEDQELPWSSRVRVRRTSLPSRLPPPAPARPRTPGRRVAAKFKMATGNQDDLKKHDDNEEESRDPEEMNPTLKAITERIRKTNKINMTMGKCWASAIHDRMEEGETEEVERLNEKLIGLIKTMERLDDERRKVLDEDEWIADWNRCEKLRKPFYDAINVARRFLAKTKHGVSSAEPVVRTGAYTKLQGLEVPVFSGDVTEYREYRRIFDSLIHERRDLSTVIKMAYLWKSLKGDALELAKTHEFEEGNYHLILEALDDEYGLDWVTQMRCYDRLVRLPHVPNPQARELMTLYNTVQAVFNTLKNCNHDLSQNPNQSIFAILLKLPPLIRKEWQISMREEICPKEELLAKFLKFLCKHAMAMGDVRNQDLIRGKDRSKPTASGESNKKKDKAKVQEVAE
ncbi:Hypothetical predicted protein, partial [Paramuricea clavata]